MEMDKEFKELLVKLCRDEGSARLAVKVLNLKLSSPGKTHDAEIRKLIAQHAATL